MAEAGMDGNPDDEDDDEDDDGLGLFDVAASAMADAGEDAEESWPRTLAVQRITEPRFVQPSGEDREAALEEEEPGRGAPPFSATAGPAPEEPALTAWNTALACIRFSMYWLRTEFSDLSLRFSSLTESTRLVRSSRVFCNSITWKEKERSK